MATSKMTPEEIKKADEIAALYTPDSIKKAMADKKTKVKPNVNSADASSN